MKIIVLNSILLALTLIYFEAIQNLLLNWNFSWTFSKSAPYLLAIIYGLIFVYKLKKLPFLRIKILKVIFLLLVFVAPFGLSFALNPIYEGDFSREGKALNNGVSLSEFENNDLLVLTIQNCPFCRESVTKMNLLIQRNPKLKIKYIVCSKNPAAKKELRAHLNNKIEIEIAQNINEIVKLAEGKFPTFIKLKHKKANYSWTNMQLGVRSLDWIESELE